MDQKTYSPHEHSLSLDAIDPDALYVMEKLRSAGFTAYLVGGGVRDLLLGYPPKDFDISTSAEPDQIKKLFRNCILIGRRFRLAHIRFGRKIFEVSTFRAGDNDNDSLIVRDNVWGSPEEDVLRRDFTINGLFYDPATETVIDYAGGYPDLQKKTLRTIGPPFIRFRQDPVRMLRLLKFQARFGLAVDSAARIALLDCRPEILKSSPVRILEELLRMLESGSSEPFLRLLAEYGFLELLVPALGEYLATLCSYPGAEPSPYAYLKKIDLSFQAIREEQPSELPLTAGTDRSVLLAALLFPMLENRMHHHFVDRERVPHLGEIYQEVQAQIDEVFQPFLLLSRRLRVELQAILTGQYRILPLEKKRSTRLRIPQDPDFPKALQFFQLRALLQPDLQPLYEEWRHVMGPEAGDISPLKKRRPRRKKGS